MTITLPEPSPKQKLFLEDRHKFIVYGGARGGGKSWAVRVKALKLCLRYPGIKVMIVRRTYPELQANHIEPMRAMVPREIASYNDTKKEFRFKNGSSIRFRFCASEKDMALFQGLELDVIFLDEATMFEEKIFRMFTACLRGVNDFPKRMYLTCNPGGPGHNWVKRIIDRNFDPADDPEEFTFIPARVQDNKALMAMDPDYVRQLEALPPKLKAAWLEGDWSVFEGQYFSEFSNHPEWDAFTHVIKPFDPPKSWKRFRSFDFGYAKPFSVGYWAVSPGENVLYRIAELYGWTGTPDEGVKWNMDKLFTEIKNLENEHPYLKGMPIEGVADPAIWQENGGVSIAEMAARHGIYFAKGDNKRIPGWMQVHYRLAFDENGKAMMYIFETCKQFIRTIPLLCFSQTHVEDLDTTMEDHIADETRYMCMRNPINPRETARRIYSDFDPLDMQPKDDDKYKFYRI